MTTTVNLDQLVKPDDLGTTRTIIVVSVRELRAALSAVTPHADLPQASEVLARVRLYVRKSCVLAAATQRYTVGMAHVGLVHDEYGDEGTVIDLTAAQVSKIQAIFKAPKASEEEAIDDDLKITVTDRFITLTDVAGIPGMPGETYTMPRLDIAKDYPDLITLVGKMTATAGSASSNAMHTSGKMLKLFQPAAAAYGQQLSIEPTSEKQGALVISVGERFLGALMPIRLDEEAVAEQKQWRQDWDRILGQVDLGTGELDPILPVPAETEWIAPGEAEPGEGQMAADLDLLVQAAELVVTAQLCTKAMLQRKLRVGFVEAADLLIELEREDIVGPEVEGKFPVLVEVEDLEQLLADLRGPGSAV